MRSAIIHKGSRNKGTRLANQCSLFSCASPARPHRRSDIRDLARVRSPRARRGGIRRRASGGRTRPQRGSAGVRYRQRHHHGGCRLACAKGSPGFLAIPCRAGLHGGGRRGHSTVQSDDQCRSHGVERSQRAWQLGDTTRKLVGLAHHSDTSCVGRLCRRDHRSFTATIQRRIEVVPNRRHDHHPGLLSHLGNLRTRRRCPTMSDLGR